MSYESNNKDSEFIDDIKENQKAMKAKRKKTPPKRWSPLCMKINTCACGQPQPSSCASRWASHNAHACEPRPERQNARKSA